eukprot:2253718-Amphidinium_carterae.1
MKQVLQWIAKMCGQCAASLFRPRVLLARLQPCPTARYTKQRQKCICTDVALVDEGCKMRTPGFYHSRLDPLLTQRVHVVVGNGCPIVATGMQGGKDAAFQHIVERFLAGETAFSHIHSTQDVPEFGPEAACDDQFPSTKEQP